MRNLLPCLLAVLTTIGCQSNTTTRTAKLPAGATTAPCTIKAPTTAPADRAVMAYVNGQPIYMDQLTDILVEAYGMPVAQQLIATALVEQQAAKQQLPTPTDPQVQEESDGVLVELFPSVTTPAQREQLLARMLQERGMLPRQWRAVMYRNVLLRQMAVKTVTVSEEEINQEYGLEYGRQVQVRHVEVPTLQAAQDVLKRLTEGADFTQVVGEASTSPTSQEGGLLPPIGQRSPVPPAIREAALALTTVGQLSEPVQSGTVFHILKLEKVIEPNAAPIAQVHDQLQERLLQQKIRGEQRRIIETLIDQARQEKQIRFANPTLQAQYNKPEE